MGMPSSQDYLILAASVYICPLLWETALHNPTDPLQSFFLSLKREVAKPNLCTERLEGCCYQRSLWILHSWFCLESRAGHCAFVGL